MLVWLIVPFYDVCGFWFVAVNSVYKLQFLHIGLSYIYRHLPKTHRVFRCCYMIMPNSRFYKVFNFIFSKVGRLASEEVIVQLLKSRCLPVLYYGLDVCPLNRDQVRLLKFAVNSCFRKIFCVRYKPWLKSVKRCLIARPSLRPYNKEI